MAVLPVEHRWLLLIHQIPPTPPYLRTKIGRRLARLGAVAVKNSVYVLPASDQRIEDVQWVRREIVAGGGDAVICEARFVEGMSDAEIENLFRAARDEDYHAVADELRTLLAGLRRRRKLDAPTRAEAEATLERVRKRNAEIATIDYFAASGGEVVAGLVHELEDRLAEEGRPVPREILPLAEYRKRTWVTRKGIHIDRMASAWLIRRFIDADAKFLFVPGKAYRARPGELRFDMFEAEFTHEGDRCTFEVLLERFGLADAGLRALAEIVHDVDLKDEKFGRSDAEGVARVVAAIALTARDDEERLARGSTLFEDLYTLFSRKPSEEDGRDRGRQRHGREHLGGVRGHE
jgi:hypothetical protein